MTEVTGVPPQTPMNTRATGPRLRLATTADPADGYLNVIRVNAQERDGLLRYLAALAQDTFEELHSVTNHPVRCAELPYLGQAFHVDGEVRPAQPGVTGTVRVEVWAGVLPVLVPQQQED